MEDYSYKASWLIGILIYFLEFYNDYIYTLPLFEFEPSCSILFIRLYAELLFASILIFPDLLNYPSELDLPISKFYALWSYFLSYNLSKLPDCRLDELLILLDISCSLYSSLSIYCRNIFLVRYPLNTFCILVAAYILFFSWFLILLLLKYWLRMYSSLQSIVSIFLFLLWFCPMLMLWEGLFNWLALFYRTELLLEKLISLFVLLLYNPIFMRSYNYYWLQSLLFFEGFYFRILVDFYGIGDIFATLFLFFDPWFWEEFFLSFLPYLLFLLLSLSLVPLFALLRALPMHVDDSLFLIFNFLAFETLPSFY